MQIHSIVILGAGNVATHLSAALQDAGYEIACIYSRNLTNAKQLAAKRGALATDQITKIPAYADLYIVAVTDTAISEIIGKLTFSPKVLVHTSGSTGMDIFEERYCNYGVFYPFQTFSKDVEMDFQLVPMCIEGSNNKVKVALTEVAAKITPKVHYLTSPQRQLLHLGAVFACNFSNYFYTLANHFLAENNIPFSLLHPLITETARKACVSTPEEVQSGPARRQDMGIISEHIALLAKHPEMQKLYEMCTQQILSMYAPIKV
jgi:predicted short-subunit dehydrogenase-like oxidoreductase (DUF2520 family)